MSTMIHWLESINGVHEIFSFRAENISLSNELLIYLIKCIYDELKI